MTQSSHRWNETLSSDQEAFVPTRCCLALCCCLLFERGAMACNAARLKRRLWFPSQVIVKSSVCASLYCCINIFFFSASLSLDFQGPNVLLLPHHHKNNNNKKTTYRTGCVVRPPWTYLYDVKPFKAVVYR